MSDDIKHLLESVDWPQPRADLSARIMAAIDQDDDSNMPSWFAASPFTRYALAAGMAACLIAGLLIGPTLQTGSGAQASQSFQWPGAGIALTYYMAS